MATAVALAQGNGHFGNSGLAKGVEQLRAVQNHAAKLLLGAGKEAGHVHQSHDGDVESVAEAHETGTLAAGVDVQHTGQHLGLVGHDTYADAAHMGEAHDDIAGIILMNLEELAVVHNGVDDLVHIVRLVGAVGNNLVQRVFLAVDGVICGNVGRFLAVVLGNIADELFDSGHNLFFGVAGKVCHTALAGVHAGAAKLLLGHLLAKHLLHYCGAGEEHIAGVLAHNGEVGEGGGVNRTAGARAKDGRNLRHNAAGEDVALENLCITGKGVDTLLDTCSAGVVEADHGSADLHSLIHNLADLLCQGL